VTAPIRPATESDAAAAARLHASLISDGFLSSLGPAFLTRLYRRIVLEPASFMFVAAGDDSVPAGFIAGTEDTGRLYRAFLLHDGPGTAIRSLGPLARNGRRVVETLRYPRAAPAAGPALPKAELLAMAVAPGQRGRGLGAALVARFQDEMGQRQPGGACVTVGAANTTAASLYRRCGFRLRTTIEVHRGAPSELLVWP
jgi:ribosomal protein S18 acetylase RimI-like enzyme